MAVREKNERLRREAQLTVLRSYFADRGEELRGINRELRSAARDVDED